MQVIDSRQRYWLTRTYRPMSTMLIALNFLAKGMIYVMPDDTMSRATQQILSSLVNYDKFWGLLCLVLGAALVASTVIKRCRHGFQVLLVACFFQCFFTVTEALSVWPLLPILMGAEIVVSLLCIIVFASYYDRRGEK